MKAQGLYDPKFEHDACGVAFVAHLGAPPSHEVVSRALDALERLEHRGAAGADADTGDGAGILIRIPHELFSRRGAAAGARRATASLSVSCRRARRLRLELEELLEATVEAEGQRLLGWRDVPVDPTLAGETAQLFAPCIRQLFVGAADGLDQDAFERKLYVIRRVAENAAGAELVIPSFSSRTIVYKGMLTPPQLRRYFPDLRDERVVEPVRARALALLDQHVPELGARAPLPAGRPQRRDQHAARQRQLDARPRVAARLATCSATTSTKVLPIVRPGGSDTAVFDNVLELLVLAGRSLPHALMMMVPEAYADAPTCPTSCAASTRSTSA